MDHRFAIGDRVLRETGAGLERTVYVVEAFDDSIENLPGYRIRPETPTSRNKRSRVVLDRWLEAAS